MSSTLNPLVAGLVVGPIDRDQASPSISFGGSAINNSGTGLYGTFGEVHVAISGTKTVSFSSSGLVIDAGGLTIASGALTLTLGGLTLTSGDLTLTSGSVVGATRLGMANDVVIIKNAGAPVNGTTGATIAGPGSLCIDYSGKALYINTNTKASPTWVAFTQAS